MCDNEPHMAGLRLIVGSLLFFGGLILIAYHKGIARQLEQFERLSRIWGSKGYEDIIGRFVWIAIGVIFALMGALVLVNR
jgi:hypothetical protein